MYKVRKMVFGKMFMKILSKDKRSKQISILIVGLNNSGKSTIVNYFKNKDDRKFISVPTIGFNVEHFESKYFFPFQLSSFHYHSKNKYISSCRQIKEFHLLLLTFRGKEDIETYGNITLNRAMELCS